MSYKVTLANPVKLDVIYSDDGICVQWNGKEWLAYDSPEAEKFRAEYLNEFRKKFNSLSGN